MNPSTTAVHAGQEPEHQFGAIIPPIYQNTTYVQESPGVFKGYDYTRAGNPNFTNLERALAALEKGQHATVFSSGLGATTALISTLKDGDKVIATNDLYGGTFRLFDRVFKNFGVQFETVNTQDLFQVKEALKSQPKYILLESPTNPLLKISDIGAIAGLAKEAGVKTIVDNTFASPYFQNPLELGADIVLHSMTKYIGGHSDATGGVVISNDPELKQQMDFARMAMGLNPAPFEMWLTQRGLKTLTVRMEKHQQNALAIAQYFEKHPKVKQVYYPGLPSHANHDIAKLQMRGFSGMVSVEFDMDLEEAKELVSSFQYFTLAESLGAVESLVDHPASMTHASLPKEEREKSGFSDGLMRFSIGIEDADDLIGDLEAALSKQTTKPRRVPGLVRSPDQTVSVGSL